MLSFCVVATGFTVWTFSFTICILSQSVKDTNKKESTLVGCIPPAYQPYVFWWPAIGISTGRWGRGLGIQREWGSYPRIILRTHPLGYLPPPRYLPPPPRYSPVDRMTDACENINFPQLLLWAVMMRLFERNYRNFPVPSKTFLFCS